MEEKSVIPWSVRIKSQGGEHSKRNFFVKPDIIIGRRSISPINTGWMLRIIMNDLLEFRKNVF